MDQAKPEERPTNPPESSALLEKLTADSHAGAPLTGAPLKESELAQNSSAAAKFLPTYDLDSQMAIWQAGDKTQAAGPPGAADKINLEKGWTERYAANFDQPNATTQHLDMAPILGLPQGASKEDLLKTAHAQEEELLKQLIS